MKKYICIKTGLIIDEETLQDIFSMNSFVTYNEKDYTRWKNDRIERGIIKEATE